MKSLILVASLFLISLSASATKLEEIEGVWLDNYDDAGIREIFIHKKAFHCTLRFHLEIRDNKPIFAILDNPKIGASFEDFLHRQEKFDDSYIDVGLTEEIEHLNPSGHSTVYRYKREGDSLTKTLHRNDDINKFYEEFTHKFKKMSDADVQKIKQLMSKRGFKIKNCKGFI